MSYVLNAPSTGIAAVSESPLSDQERELRLSDALAYKAKQGAGVVHRDQFRAVVSSGKPVNHILHLLLSVFTLGLWLIVWLIVAIGGGKKQRTITVDEYGRVVQS